MLHMISQGGGRWMSKIAMILFFENYVDRRPCRICSCDNNLNSEKIRASGNKDKVPIEKDAKISKSSNNGHGTSSCRSRCNLAWVKDHGESTQAECSVVYRPGTHQRKQQACNKSNPTSALLNRNNDNDKNNFDPVHSKFFEIKLTTSSSSSRRDAGVDTLSLKTETSKAILESSDKGSKEVIEKATPLSSTSTTVADDSAAVPLLFNTIIVLPDLLTVKECELIILDTERILQQNNKMNKGVKTEKWTMYSNFSPDCQRIIDRLLKEHVLRFIQLRLPHVAKKLFRHNCHGDAWQGRSKSECSTGTSTDMGSISHDANIYNNDASDHDEQGFVRTKTKTEVSSSSSNHVDHKILDGFYHWDDPVVIKYIAGNCLAPHEDMRELTIVIPLNPLSSSSDAEKDKNDKFPLVGGGTRFWLEGINPDSAKSYDGVSIQPPPGSGIIFNGDITHSGNSVFKGTRFVLMTSICLDDNCGSDDNDEN